MGAKPVIVNINDTFNMDPIELEKAMTPKTRAILPVHMLGVAAELDNILAIARKYGIPVFEDNCESLGAEWGNKKLGTQFDLCAWSFDFGKTLTTGEGGMVTMNNEEYFTIVREYHDHGHQYNASLPRGLDNQGRPGFNYRMTELQAAVGLVQLRKLDHIVQMNTKHHRIYVDALRDEDMIKFGRIP